MKNMLEKNVILLKKSRVNFTNDDGQLIQGTKLIGFDPDNLKNSDYAVGIDIFSFWLPLEMFNSRELENLPGLYIMSYDLDFAGKTAKVLPKNFNYIGVPSFDGIDILN